MRRKAFVKMIKMNGMNVSALRACILNWLATIMTIYPVTIIMSFTGHCAAYASIQTNSYSEGRFVIMLMIGMQSPHTLV